MMEGGADTTAMFLQFFVLCMLANPDVKERAQQEIDKVIGQNRSPELEDLNDLPYVRAIINEVTAIRRLRYKALTPYLLGAPLSSRCSNIHTSCSTGRYYGKKEYHGLSVHTQTSVFLRWGDTLSLKGPLSSWNLCEFSYPCTELPLD